MSRAVQIKFKLIAPIINPRYLARGSVRRPFVDLLEQMTLNFERDYQSVSGKFKDHKVRYKRAVRYGRPPVATKRIGMTANASKDALYGITTTDSDVMRWLDDGTRVRYAVMTAGFVSLTMPHGGLATRSPRGRRSGFGIKPGIEPREFSLAVAVENAGEFITGVINANQVIAASFFLGSETRNP